jgi:hypothetical protein
MHQRCHVIVKHCYVDHERLVHHHKVHFDPMSEWACVYDTARSLILKQWIYVYPIPRVIWQLIDSKDKKASGHSLIAASYMHFSPGDILDTGGCLEDLYDNNREVHLYICPYTISTVKTQVWTLHVPIIDMYMLGAGECTVNPVEKASAGYTTDIADVVGQCINHENIGSYLYIIPLMFLRSFYGPSSWNTSGACRMSCPGSRPRGRTGWSMSPIASSYP